MPKFKRKLSFGELEVTTPNLEVLKSDADDLVEHIEIGFSSMTIVCEECNGDVDSKITAMIDQHNLFVSGTFTCRDCGHVMKEIGIGGS